MVQLFKQSDLGRLRRFVADAGITSPPDHRGIGRPRERQCDVVEVTSATPSGGVYPAKRTVWHDDSSTWYDDDNCRVLPLRGGVPLLQRYLGYSIGSKAGFPLYAIRDHGTLTAVRTLTNVCPIFTTVYDRTVVGGVEEEKTIVNLPAGYTLGTPTCADADLACCSPLDINAECGGPCGSCATAPRIWFLPMSGFVDTDCFEDYNRDWYMVFSPGFLLNCCAWVASSDATVDTPYLIYNSISDTWSVIFQLLSGGPVAAVYVIDDADFNCTGTNVLTLDTSNCGTWPGTITIYPELP